MDINLSQRGPSIGTNLFPPGTENVFTYRHLSTGLKYVGYNYRRLKVTREKPFILNLKYGRRKYKM